MAPEVVRCFLEGANAGQDQLHCNCPPSCHDSNFKVKNLNVIVFVIVVVRSTVVVKIVHVVIVSVFTKN